MMRNDMPIISMRFRFSNLRRPLHHEKIKPPQLQFRESVIGNTSLNPKSPDDIPAIPINLQYVYTNSPICKRLFFFLEERFLPDADFQALLPGDRNGGYPADVRLLRDALRVLVRYATESARIVNLLICGFRSGYLGPYCWSRGDVSVTLQDPDATDWNIPAAFTTKMRFVATILKGEKK